MTKGRQISAQGRLPEMMEAQDEGMNSFVSLGCGVVAGLLVALAGASPALAQRNQFGFTSGMDEEVTKLDVGAICRMSWGKAREPEPIVKMSTCWKILKAQP